MKTDQIVQSRINGDIKLQASLALEAMGLTISDAIRMLLSKIAYDKELPFTPLTPNETTIKAIKEARSKKLKRYKSVKEALDALNEGD